jgi:ribosomal protein L19E
MADLSEFRRFNPDLCKVGVERRNLSKDQQESLDAALREPDITNNEIARWMSSKLDSTVSHITVKSHREGKCVCARFK